MAVILSSQLGNLVKVFSDGKIRRSVLETSNVIGSQSLETVKANGSEHRVNIVTGGEASAQWISDGEDLAQGNSNLHSTGTVLPAGLFAQLRIGRMAADMEVSAGQATSLFMSEMDRVANSLARHLGRGLYGHAVSPAAATTWDGYTSGSTASVTFTDVSGFKPGASYEFDDVSGGKTYVVRCTNVAYGAVGSASANVAGTVTFVNDVGNPGNSFAVVTLGELTISTNDVFRLRGTSPSSASFGASSSSTSQAMVSFDDIAGSSTLHGIAGTVAGWSGNSLALSAAYSQESMLAFMSRISARSGMAPTHVIMHPSLMPVHAAAGLSAGGTQFGIASAGSGARRDVSADFDKYGINVQDIAQRAKSGLALGGKEIILDDNCPVGKVYFHNKSAVKLIEWVPLGAVKQSGNSQLVSQTTFEYRVQFHGGLNLACNMRSAIGVVTDITNL
jgi:hypothetical protein